MTELDQAEHVDGHAPGDPAGQLPAGATADDARVAGDVRDPFDEGAEDALLADALGAPTLEAACEAVLLLADEPMDMLTLATIVRRPADQVEAVVRGLSAQYTEDGRGFDLREVGGGWRFYTRGDCAEVVSRYVVDGQQARLTQAALETLAVIAYRQPVTRARVSAVRGVNVDGVVRTLLARGLIADAGQDPDSAGMQYRTTPLFLERLGLQSLDDLPALAPLLPELSELDDAATSS